MPQYHTHGEIAEEALQADKKEKPTAYSGRKYPIEYLDSRDFERLVYFLFKYEIDNGLHKGSYDTVLLMKGVAERGRDSILQFRGENTALIQCKRYTSRIGLPDMCREVVKFALHAAQDKELMSDVSPFTYYFTALSGVSEPAIKYLYDFGTKITEDERLEQWTNEVIKEYESIIFKDYDEVAEDLIQILKKIKLELLTGDDLDRKLKSAKDVVIVFFEVEKVANEEMLRKVFQEYVGFKNDEDLEKLRLRLQGIPEEKRLMFGLFSIYGYNKEFYQKILRDKNLVFQIADIKNTLNARFIDYLQETIHKYCLLFVTGIKEVSPFTKQVVPPYVFNKYALILHKKEAGELFFEMRSEKGFVEQHQTIEQIKSHLLETGRRVLANDYSTFVGDPSVIALKKELATFIHAEFKTVEEMSARFDKDMVVLMPVIGKIEALIAEVLPSNPTIIIESNGAVNSIDDLVSMIKKVSKYNET